MELLKNIMNIFSPYIYTMMMVLFVYRSIQFFRAKEERKEEGEEEFLRWQRKRMKKFMDQIFFFHWFSFLLLFFNRYSFFTEDLESFRRFLLFAAISFLGLLLFFMIGTRLFAYGEQWILGAVAFWSDIGFVMLYRLHSTTAIKQMQWFAVGILLLFFIPMVFRYVRQLEKLKWVYIGASIALLLITALFGKEIYGAKNWLAIGGIQFQPSEFVKLLFTFYMATIFMQARVVRDLYIPALLVGIILLFLLLQRDLGSVLLYSLTLLVMMYISLSKKRYLLMLLGAGGIGAFFSYFLFSHIQRRISAWWNPWSDVPNVGYQIAQGLFGIANGGWFGAGLDRGLPRKIPIVETDFIFAAICEEFGVIFAIGILGLFGIFMYQVLKLAMGKSKPYFMLLVIGFASMIGLQTFIIVGGVIKLIPLTGVTLPFISYGGSSMIVNMIFIGLIVYLSIHGNPLEEGWE